MKMLLPLSGSAIKRFSAELLRPDQKKLVFPTDSLEQEKFVVVAKQIQITYCHQLIQ